MPTYEYECINCGHHFEVFQMMSDKPIKTCPKCRKPVRRLIGTGSGIIFKGPGFYATDYRKTKPPQAAEEERKDQAVSQQDKKPQDKQPQDKKPQDKKSQRKKPHQKDISGAKDKKSE